MRDYDDDPRYLDDLLADDADRRAEHYALQEYDHSERGSYWVWVEGVARDLQA